LPRDRQDCRGIKPAADEDDGFGRDAAHEEKFAFEFSRRRYSCAPVTNGKGTPPGRKPSADRRQP
jgi:hypothetical protein